MKKLHLALLAALMGLSAPVMANHDGMGEHCKMHTKVSFDDADKDKDGTLDREEAKVVCGEKFDIMDADKDGTLTKDEVNACGRKKHSKSSKTKSEK
jgi:Ca2+-binding EF-hand superfamily protein